MWTLLWSWSQVVSFLPTIGCREWIPLGKVAAMKKTFLFLGLTLLLLTFSNILWADEWVELFPAKKPSVRYGQTIVEINGYIYLYGGMDNTEAMGEIHPMGEAYNDLWRYDPNNKEWTDLNSPSSPPARSNHSAAVSNGKMYIFFGRDKNGNPLDDIWRYDPATNQWGKEAPRTTPGMPSGRFAHTSVTLSGEGGRYIFVYGGKEADTFVWLYDTLDFIWRKISVPPPYDGSVFGQSADVIGDYVYLFGGMDSQGPTNKVCIYDIIRQSWLTLSQQGSQPPRRYLHGEVTIGNYLHIVGGIGSGGQLADYWKYDANANTWTQGPSLPTPLSDHAAAYLTSGKIIVFGGIIGTTPTNRSFALPVSGGSSRGLKVPLILLLD